MSQARSVGARMRHARQLAGMTQEEVANHLDVTLRTYSRWETGASAGHLQLLGRIAEVLGVEVGQLVQDDEPPRDEIAARLDAIERQLRALHREVRALRRRP